MAPIFDVMLHIILCSEAANSGTAAWVTIVVPTTLVSKQLIISSGEVFITGSTG
eukprot:CAMPEP_0197862532 /NCGR_PEP_ID=MMETSP1438-20131217/39379_1 /TAXON_ID=1461541 /ORGANISM="Pterosperma sp., Strain CCMP1384" /LENGTH=53 /DNA_ID=CAMNT_0043480121 /DNA_START=105 /DNA_END=266 /DNA_ORIENTATION=-